MTPPGPARRPPAASVDEVLALYDRWGTHRYDEEVAQLAHALQVAALAIRSGADDPVVAAALLHDVGHLLALDAASRPPTSPPAGPSSVTSAQATGEPHDPRGPQEPHLERTAQAAQTAQRTRQAQTAHRPQLAQTAHRPQPAQPAQEPQEPQPQGPRWPHQPHEVSGSAYLAGLFPPAVTDPIARHVAAKRYLCAVDPGYHGGLSAGSVASLRRQGGPMSPDEARAFAAAPGSAAAVALRRWDDAGKVDGLAVPGLDEFASPLRALATGGTGSRG